MSILKRFTVSFRNTLSMSAQEWESGDRRSPSPMDVDAGSLRTTARDTGHTSRQAPRSRSAPEAIPPSIYFYNRGQPYFEFTNFSDHSITYRSLTYPTAEHLFQAHKFLEHRPDLADRIRRIPTAREARAEAGRMRASQRWDWFDVNVAIMDEVLKAKFEQHRDLRRMLRDTGTKELLEDSPDDVFWGIGRDGSGRNELGKALMRLRDYLQHDRTQGRRSGGHM